MLGCPAWAASFDCAKASAPDERAVCADPRLSDLDGLMGRSYADAQAKADKDEHGELVSDARAFMTRRHACGTDVACMLSAYIGILEAFEAYGSTVAVPATISALDMAGSVPPETRSLPAKEGECVATRVDQRAGRLEGDKAFDTGMSVSFANGGFQVSYEKVPAIVGSRTGDRVVMCLTAIPRHCPPGDDRGRMYTVTNLRTHGTWSLPDSEHMCGGA